MGIAYALPNYERPVLVELEAALESRLFKGIKVHAGELAIRQEDKDKILGGTIARLLKLPT